MTQVNRVEAPCMKKIKKSNPKQFKYQMMKLGEKSIIWKDLKINSN